jgi:hypothetical protein
MLIIAAVFDGIGGSDATCYFHEMEFVLVFSGEIHHIMSHDIVFFRKREWIAISQFFSKLLLREGRRMQLYRNRRLSFMGTIMCKVSITKY